ncbi:MAG: hypothetical protein L0229_14370, partial [Blastocatellia bacterium]|nr:hypothetical protein [Blastocatellia bacterium]
PKESAIERDGLVMDFRHPGMRIFMLASDGFFGLFGGTLSESSGDVEPASGTVSDGFISQRLRKVFLRPEDFNEVRKNPDIKMNEGDEKEGFTRVQVVEVDAGSAAHRVRRLFFMGFLHEITLL